MGVKVLGRILSLVLAAWAVTFLVVLAVQFFWPERPTPDASADAIVCLGAGMSNRGWELPDDRSLQRARSCAALLELGAAPVAVFTGYGHHVSSAGAAMADAARAAGAPTSAVIVETEAKSTLQNADLSLRLLPEGADHVIVVSDAYHLPRAWIIFRLMGFDEVVLRRVPAEHQVAPPGMRIYAREAFALWFNAGRLVVYWAGGIAGVDHVTRMAWFN